MERIELPCDNPCCCKIRAKLNEIVDWINVKDAVKSVKVRSLLNSNTLIHHYDMREEPTKRGESYVG